MPSIAIPEADNANVLALSRSLVADQQPIYVKHQALSGKPLKECFSIVTQQVAEHGGQEVFGWALLELTGIWLEAEFHAVWQLPDGSWLDVTPRQFIPREVLFLPDPNRRHEGVQIASKFHPLTSHPAVLRHIQLAREFFVETNKGELAFASSYAVTPKIPQIQAEMQYLLPLFPWPYE